MRERGDSMSSAPLSPSLAGARPLSSYCVSSSMIKDGIELGTFPRTSLEVMSNTVPETFNKMSIVVRTLSRSAVVRFSSDYPMFCLVVVLSTIALLRFPWIHFGWNGWQVWCEKLHGAWGIQISAYLNAINAVLAAGAVVFLNLALWQDFQSHPHLTSALFCVRVFWLQNVISSLQSFMFVDRKSFAYTVVMTLEILFWAIGAIWLQHLVLMRIMVLESSMCKNLRSSLITRLFRPQLLLVLILIPLRVLHHVGKGTVGKKVVYVYSVGWLVFSMLQGASYSLMWRAMNSPYKAIKGLRQRLESAEFATADIREEVRWALKTSFWQMCGIMWSCIFEIIHTICKAVFDVFFLPAYRGTDRLEWFSFYLVVLPKFLDALSSLLCAMALSGAFSVNIHVVFRQQTNYPSSHELRLARREESTGAGRHDGMGTAWLDGTPGWREKVHELAGRGISLDKFLLFYTGLGSEYMEHFNSCVHTTEDVVRQAIIPFSASVGSPASCASILMDGVYTRPSKMVTHNWRNLFRDLVAAVVADALNECDFGTIAYLLDNNISQLVEWLNIKSKLQRTYWICAFSVDQHASICGGNAGGRKDPVTDQEHPICKCRVPKAFNHTPPLDCDGRSIPCEMNKFADMMTYLSLTDDHFEQVIAVDADFNLFNRAWCVAELAQAHRMGMKQHLKVQSKNSLAAHEGKLKHLQVEKMEASRSEDVEEILATIPDKAEFNRSLQHLIFDKDGLLAAWRGMDTAQQMTRVGRLARFDSASQGRVSIWDV